MPDGLGRIDEEIQRLRRRCHGFSERLGLLDVALLRLEARVGAIEVWQGLRDPELDALIDAQKVADEVERRMRRVHEGRWTFGQRVLAWVVGLAAVGGFVLSLLRSLP